MTMRSQQNSCCGVQMSQAAQLVLLYDHLLGEGVKPHGPLERRFLKHDASFQQAVEQHLHQQGVATLRQLADQAGGHAGAHSGVRHVRVNTLQATVAQMCEQLQSPLRSWPQKHQQPITATPDEHLPDVLAVPSGVDLHDHPLVQSGVLALQSKASCMPAHALQLRAGMHVVDCCAAPGNKTSHAAALVGTHGHVTAFEKDEGRCQLLRNTLHRAGVQHATVLCEVRW